MTYHAVMRYVQRILKVVVEVEPAANTIEANSTTRNLYLAQCHCDAIGKTVDDIRDEILTEPVTAACRGGFKSFMQDEARYIIDRGIIVSVVRRGRPKIRLRPPKPPPDEIKQIAPKKKRRNVPARRHRFRSR